jgi:DUF971 family protein
MRATQIKQTGESGLIVVWDDGHSGPIALQELRDACPCAECAGETVLFRTYVSPNADKESPGRYTLAAAEPVGGYAIQFTWKDGHNLGIYTWEQLRTLCGCVACRANKDV